jgi:glutaminase
VSTPLTRRSTSNRQGDPFNEISLAPCTGRPANAMINAGALAVVSMIKGSGGKSAPRRITEFYSKFAGRRLTGSKAVLDVEMRNSDRNHSLAYLLSSFGVIEDSPTRALGELSATVFDSGDVPRSVADGRDLGERRNQPAHR